MEITCTVKRWPQVVWGTLLKLGRIKFDGTGVTIRNQRLCTPDIPHMSRCDHSKRKFISLFASHPSDNGWDSKTMTAYISGTAHDDAYGNGILESGCKNSKILETARKSGWRNITSDPLDVSRYGTGWVSLWTFSVRGERPLKSQHALDTSEARAQSPGQKHYFVKNTMRKLLSRTRQYKLLESWSFQSM